MINPKKREEMWNKFKKDITALWDDSDAVLVRCVKELKEGIDEESRTEETRDSEVFKAAEIGMLLGKYTTPFKNHDFAFSKFISRDNFLKEIARKLYSI